MSLFSMYKEKNDPRKKIFVFGSNLAGRHGKGAALYAWQKCGAQTGIGEGLTGNSYAIPTKSATLQTLPLSEIQKYIWRFIDFAIWNPDMLFEVTPIGCGLAGYTPDDIIPLFKCHGELPKNICWHERWEKDYGINPDIRLRKIC